MDRQGILDKLTSIETTAKLLIKALNLSKTPEEHEFALQGLHREELFSQTKIFLEQAQKLVENLSNSFNVSTEKVRVDPPVAA